MTKKFFAHSCIAAALFTGISVHAQPSSRVTVYATGLTNPRGLAFDPVDQVLYVAEAGLGGSNSTIGECTQAPPPLGPFYGGNTARIVGIDPAGYSFTLVDELPSTQTQFGNIMGPTDIEFIDDDLYVLVAAGCTKGHRDFPNAVARFTGTGLDIVADISAYHLASPRAIPVDDDHDVEGNPYSFVATAHGDLLVVEANHSTVVRVSPYGVITQFADMAALTQVYDTPVAADIDAQGNLYIGSYGEVPFLPGTSKIYKLTPSGDLSVFARGFTTLIDIAFDEHGYLYVLETSTGHLDEPPFLKPDSGRLSRIDARGKVRHIVNHLDYPTAMTFGPDGALYVANGGHSLQPSVGRGEILRIDVSDVPGPGRGKNGYTRW